MATASSSALSTPAVADTNDPELDRLRELLLARHQPVDLVEAHWAEELAWAVRRQQRLRALEAAALARTDEPDLRLLVVLARYRARVERDLRLAQAQIDLAKAAPPGS